MTARRAAGAAVALVALPFLLLLSCAVLFAKPATASCSSGGTAVDVGAVPGGGIAGYSGDQLTNAAKVMQAAKDAQLSVRGQTIGVMTAMGESSLVDVTYGDQAGPDSRGLFQQRDPWGPLADRMDPYKAATMFFTGGQGGQSGLVDIPGWESLTPTLAAHAVQRNADPFHYTKYWDAAVAVVSGLAGVPVDVAPGAGDQVCTDAGAGSIPVGPGGWVRPAIGTLSSGFSTRINPVTGAVEHHNGQDIANVCGSPIYAAAAGTVVKAGPSTGFGNLIAVDHGGGLVTWYGHEYNDGLLVRVGDQVAAGQQIGKIGSNGQSTGCHVHFEVHVNGAPVDPVPFMAAHGAALG